MVQTPAILAVGALGQQFPLQREGVVPSTDSSVSFTTGVSNSSAYGSQTDNGEESNQPIKSMNRTRGTDFGELENTAWCRGTRKPAQLIG